MADPQPRRLPIQRLSYRQLLITPGLLSAAFVAIVIVHSLRDVNQGLLYSQCHARSRVPWLSQIPLLGSPLCYLVSSLHEALASLKSSAVVSEILALLGGLLTVCTVEAARACNSSSALIAHPTGSWLLFALAGALGGQLAFALVIVPAFLRRSKGLALLAEAEESAPVAPDGTEAEAVRQLAVDSRDLNFAAEAIAVPAAVAGGFVAPSAVMLGTNSPVAIFVWLFFPVLVAVLRRVVRSVLIRASPQRAAPSFRLERSKKALAGVYGLPVISSVLAHAWTFWSLVGKAADDRKEMTKSAIKFFEIDAGFVGLTMLYWLLVEGGWRNAAVAVVASAVLGPGAGACVAWLYREWTVHGASLVEGPPWEENPDGRMGGSRVDEETPLLA